jgi:hypothetical protein
LYWWRVALIDIVLVALGSESTLCTFNLTVQFQSTHNSVVFVPSLPSCVSDVLQERRLSGVTLWNQQNSDNEIGKWLELFQA